MIDCLNITNAHLYGDAMASQYRLRHRVFVDRQKYDVPTWRGMEYDQFDTPVAHYFVWRDQFGEARSVARMSPTSRPYMLEQLWADKVTDINLPHSDAIWEGTRFGVDRDLSPRMRNQIIREMVISFTEFAEMNAIDAFIGIMPKIVLRTHFERNGWPVEYIGPEWEEDGLRVCAARLLITDEATKAVRDKLGIHHCVLSQTPGRMPHTMAA